MPHSRQLDLLHPFDSYFCMVHPNIHPSASRPSQAMVFPIKVLLLSSILAYLNLLDLITLTMLGEQSSSLCKKCKSVARRLRRAKID